MSLLSVLVARRVARASVLPVAALAVAATTAFPLAAVAADEQQVRPDTSALQGATPAPDLAAPEPSGSEAPAPGTPAAETPAPEAPAAEIPAPETPAPEAPAPEVRVVEALPGGPACGGGALGEGPGAGAVDPRDGQRYVASLVASPVDGDLLRLSVVLPSGDVSAPVADVRLPGVDPGAVAVGGGIAFDAAGRLYVVTAGAGSAVLHRTDAPLGDADDPATTLVQVAVERVVERIAFDADGLLHLADDAGSTVVDPTSGEVVAELGAAEGQALACGRPSQLSVTLALPGGRVDTTDRFRVGIAGAGYGTAGPRGAWTATGLVVPGTTYDLLVTATAGTDLTTYDATWDCGPVGATTGTTAQVTAPRAAFGSDTGCVVTLVPADPADTSGSGDGSGVGDPVGLTPRLGALPGAPRLQSLDTSRRDGSAGVGLPGIDLPDMSGLLSGSDTVAERDRTAGDGIDLGDGNGLGLGTNPDLGAQQEQAAGGNGPLDPVLPNTGGPSAVAIPVGLGAVVAGSVLISRRRRSA